MSQYTISLKSIIDNEGKTAVIGNIRKRVEIGRQILFNFDYAATNEFKELFETQFILDYLLEDICYYDFEYWLLSLQNTIKSTIPTFNKMYEVLKNAEDIASDTSVIHTHSGESHNVGNTKSTGESKSKGLGSNYPVDISNAKDFTDVKYMDSGNMNESTSLGNSESNIDNSDKSTDKTVNNRNILEKLSTLNKAQFDVVKGAVNSFSHLFMILW